MSWMRLIRGAWRLEGVSVSLPADEEGGCAVLAQSVVNVGSLGNGLICKQGEKTVFGSSNWFCQLGTFK